MQNSVDGKREGVRAERTEGARHPRWIRRLAPICLLILIALVGARTAGRQLAGQAHETIRAELDAEGLSWVQVTIAGRAARLTGAVASSGGGSRALEITRGAMCETWLSTRACVTRVSADFGTTLRGAEVWPTIAGTLKDQILTLEGEVPDHATRQIVMDAAREAIGRGGVASVVDGLAISGSHSPSGSQPLLKRLTAALSLCVRGEAALQNGTASLRCETGQELEAEVRELLSLPLPAGTLGELQIEVTEDAL